jgi:phosphoribosylaminoimidazole (AIR) synthetase
MRRTFNNGIGMIAAVPESAADEIVERLNAMGEKSFVIGEIVERKGQGPRIKWV